MRPAVRRALLVALMASGLAACGNGSGSDTPAPPPPPVVATPQENQFGANFATAYRAANTSAPITPADGDIIPLSLTTNPVNVG